MLLVTTVVVLDRKIIHLPAVYFASPLFHVISCLLVMQLKLLFPKFKFSCTLVIAGHLVSDGRGRLTAAGWA